MSEITKKEKRQLRTRICVLMDQGRTDEAKVLMDVLCPSNDPKTKDGDNRLRKVRLTDAGGNVKEYQSITECAKAYNVARSTILRAVKVGTPVSGVFAGYSVSLDGKSSKKGSRPTIAIRAISPEGDITIFGSVHDALDIMGVGYAAFYKSIKGGTVVTKGSYVGWKFERVEK